MPRIVSDFHDYYDSVQSFNAGKDDIVWQRKQREQDFPKNPPRDLPFPIFMEYDRREINLSQYVIGFCGRCFPLLVIEKVCCYAVAEVDKLVEAVFKKRHKTAYFEQKKFLHRDRVLSRKGVVEHFAKDFQKNAEQFFVKDPVFVFHYHRWKESSIVFNDQLKQYEFYRISDSYTAFQEIQMFLSNLAYPNRPIPAVSDKDMRDAKGFDKFSFRKDKE